MRAQRLRTHGSIVSGLGNVLSASGPPWKAETDGWPTEVPLGPTEESQWGGPSAWDSISAPKLLVTLGSSSHRFLIAKCRLPTSWGSPKGSLRSQSTRVPPVPFPLSLLLSSSRLLCLHALFPSSFTPYSLPPLPTPQHPRKGSEPLPPAAPARAATSALVPAQELASGALLTGSSQEPTRRVWASLHNPVTLRWYLAPVCGGSIHTREVSSHPRSSLLFAFMRARP